jgi:hypothetical protein
MANTKRIDKSDELGFYLYEVLKLPKKDQTLKTILELFESRLDSVGTLAIKSLLEYALTLKMDKLKKEIREVLDQK